VSPAALGDGQREARLAHPAGAGEHDQAAVQGFQQLDDLIDVAVPAHERGNRRRDQVRPFAVAGSAEALGEQRRQVVQQ
jgi:hypothetical protein